MIFHKEIKLKIEQLFLPFDKWVPVYKKARTEETQLEPSSILISDGSDHDICKPFLTQIEKLKAKVRAEIQEKRKDTEKIKKEKM